MHHTFLNRLTEEYNSDLDHAGINGERIASRLAELSKIGSEENGGLTRIGYSMEEKQAKELVISWMKEAGLSVVMDGAGNVFGRLEGQKDSAAVMSGSHLDSVPNGGHFDGPLGVLSALEVVEAWKDTGYTPPAPFEVAIFTDEEGSRFKTGLTGSRSFMGKVSNEELDHLRDESGKTFDEVIEAYGSNRESYLEAHDKSKDLKLFVEVHIEQGTVLEKHNEPAGIVNGIAGPSWLEVSFKGKAGHAGNTPMENRKDPVIAAGIFVHEIESLPRKVSQTAVATVGKMNVIPNGVNVIAQEVNLMVDIRDITEETRDKLLEMIHQKAEEIAAKRGIEVTWNINTRIKPLPIDPDLQGKLAAIMEKQGIKPVYIPSGAGHDAMIIGGEVPVAMIFTRSKDGISHNPEEWSSLNDCVNTVHVLKRFVEEIMEED
ncbi:M20 family metallo-hydrolase [Oceanobacillus damuensis]|uniref:M20 family metallo-hydrolase n=1 Tax=Oceanobacillus damuensis TaxID=937928 RepID=UPI0008361993|nr:M20 family metallo-hydrolase [Oceanobacillus damuensis]